MFDMLCMTDNIVVL